MKIAFGFLSLSVFSGAMTSCLVLDGTPDGVSFWFAVVQAAFALAGFVAAMKNWS